MSTIAALALTLVLCVPPAAAASVAAAPEAVARAKPTAEQKRCLAATRRVERQREVIAAADARLQRDRTARESCRSRRACDSLDRALKAGEARSARHAKQLAQFEQDAARICASATAPR